MNVFKKNPEGGNYLIITYNQFSDNFSSIWNYQWDLSVASVQRHKLQLTIWNIKTAYHMSADLSWKRKLLSLFTNHIYKHTFKYIASILKIHTKFGLQMCINYGKNIFYYVIFYIWNCFKSNSFFCPYLILIVFFLVYLPCDIIIKFIKLLYASFIVLAHLVQIATP